MPVLLFIEDDKHLGHGITCQLEKNNYTVQHAATLAAGWVMFTTSNVDLVILDVNMPDGDGLDFCRRLRAGGKNVPVVMLTARDMEQDELAGLGAGADDYITKPFSADVLLARVSSLLRRSGMAGQTIQSGAYVLDTALGKLYRGGAEILLSLTEYRLVKLLMENAGKVQTKEHIQTVVWDAPEDCLDENTLSVNINRLRGKIEKNPKKPAHIKTIYGIGYCWVG